MFGFLNALKMHTFTMFLTQCSLLRETGIPPKESLRGAVDFFRSRKPFDQLTEQDVEAITETISNLNYPEEVGAILFQKCDGDHINLKHLKEQDSLTRWALTEDTETTIMKMLDAAKDMCAKHPNRSVMDGVVFALAKRDGWRPTEQHSDGILFNYHGTPVKICNSNTGKGILKEVIRAEFALRAQNPSNLVDHFIRKGVVSHFDEFFEGVWEEFKKSPIDQPSVAPPATPSSTPTSDTQIGGKVDNVKEKKYPKPKERYVEVPSHLLQVGGFPPPEPGRYLPVNHQYTPDELSQLDIARQKSLQETTAEKEIPKSDHSPSTKDNRPTEDRSELVFNLWAYIDQRAGLVYAVAGKAYSLTGTDEQKLAVLQQLAATDHLTVKRRSLAKNFSVTDGKKRLEGMMSASVVRENIGEAFESVFRSIEANLPPIPNFLTNDHTLQRIPQQPLQALTFLMEDDVGNVTPITNLDLSRKFALEQYKRELMSLGFSEEDAEEAAQHWAREQTKSAPSIQHVMPETTAEDEIAKSAQSTSPNDSRKHMITENDVRKILQKHVGADGLESARISSEPPPNINVYGGLPGNCWYVMTSYGRGIGPSRLICVSKIDGRIVLDASACDEG